MEETIDKIRQLRNEGLTYQAIGERLGISRQRIYQLLFPDKFRAYQRAYQRTDKFRAYQRAYQRTDKFRAYKRAYKRSDKYRAYRRAYQRSDKYRAYRRAYQRHIYHLKINKKFKNCEKCIN